MALKLRKQRSPSLEASSGNSVSQTLANALRLNGSPERPRTYVSNSIYSPPKSERFYSPSKSERSSTPNNNEWNERYYQAQIVHLQTSLVQEHRLFVRASIGFSILVTLMLACIFFLLRRPANCDHVGHRFNMPIFSPWSASHEKEHYTTAGWNITSVALFTTVCLLVWQNKDTILVPVLKFLPEIRHVLFR